MWLYWCIIVVKGRITVQGDNDNKKINKKLIYKKNVSFRSCISKINNKFEDNTENLDIPIYNLLEYSDNYSTVSVSLWNYYRDKTNDGANENHNAGNKIDNSKTIASISF